MKLVLLLALIMFHRLDGHPVWLDPGDVKTVQGAGQLGYKRGTLINMCPGAIIVKENVNDVVRAIKAAK